MHPRLVRRLARAFSFPRTRGDAPAIMSGTRCFTALPPHTRGCTVGVACPWWHSAASPAHAGMHPPAMTLVDPPCRFPRTRGDAPEIIFKQQTCLMLPRTRGDAPRNRRIEQHCAVLPPHTRGCTRSPYPLRLCSAASPAHAGMHLFPTGRARSGARFPRTRGDAPEIRRWTAHTPKLPPHTRGCTRNSSGPARRRRASPAHAGMQAVAIDEHGGRLSFPRTRGDAPAVPVSL